jgi:hypothetical protein
MIFSLNDLRIDSAPLTAKNASGSLKCGREGVDN